MEKIAFSLNANSENNGAQVNEVQVYEFERDKVLAPEGQRKVFFGKTINWGFDQLPKGEQCTIKASFLSDTERILYISANGIVLDDCFSPEPGKVVDREWTIPSRYLNKGYLTFTVYTLSGPNAVLQKIEILTANGKPLKLHTGKDIAAYSDEDIDRLALPKPRLTPRPSAVTGVKKASISLNGVWQFSPTGNASDFSPIQVPGEWKMQGFDVTPYKMALYRKSFSIPGNWTGKRIKLRFDSVHSDCRVLMNGREAGTHKGGMVPFEFDITDLAGTGNNVLEVFVRSESIADYMSCISEYAAHRVGGILRKVTIFAVPETCLADEFYHTDVRSNPDRATVYYQAEISNEGKMPDKAGLKVALLDPKGNVVGEKSVELHLEKGETEVATVQFDVDKPSLWTSETPTLYKLEIQLLSNGTKSSEKSLKIGLREIEVKGNTLLINGKEVKLLGVNRHEVHPLTGRSLTPELCRKDAEMYKSANVNLVRTSHYPPSEEFLDACDELGLFVECEPALCWVGQNAVWHSKFNVLDPSFFRYAHIANMDQIVAYKNHPSIIIWSLSNESNWNQWWGNVLKANKKLDSTRPYTFHHQQMTGEQIGKWGLGIANQHYPDEHNTDRWSSHKEPLWFGEYAHLQCYNRRELMTDPFIQEDWSRPLQRMVDLIWKQKGCLGGAIWSGIDDIFILPDGTECGYGSWGPIDGWRREKPEYHGMRMAYTPMRLFSSSLDKDGHLVLQVQNRFNFKNFNQLSLRWECRGESGALAVDIDPHARGNIVIEKAFSKDSPVDLVLCDEQGKEIVRERIVLPGTAEREIDAELVKNLVPVRIDDKSTQIGSSVIPALPLPVPLIQGVNGEGGTQLKGQKILPLIDMGEWEWTDSSTQEGTHRFQGKGEMGTGILEMTPEANGLVKVKYEVEVAWDVNPRQWGLVFTLPGEFDTIEWNRKAHWSWYPEGHIGRQQGQARAMAASPGKNDAPSSAVAKFWKDESTIIGSNDFRGTKNNINFCQLKALDGRSMIILPAKKTDNTSVRAWKDGDKIRVMVAGFTTGGSDRFFWVHYQDEYKKLKKGDKISSEFMIGVKK